MICPNCNNNIDDNSTFCPLCGCNIAEFYEKLRKQDMKQCPFCSKLIKAQAKKCRYCGRWLNEDTEKIDISTDLNQSEPQSKTKKTLFPAIIKVTAWIIAVVIVVLLLFLLVSVKEQFTLPKCDSDFAQELVTRVFIQNNYDYKKLFNAGLVESVYLTDILPVSYDKSLNKYTCEGRIVVKAVDAGFSPIIYRGRWMSEHQRFGKAVCHSKYYIYKEKGKNTIWATYCSNGIDYEDYFYK